MALKSDDSDIQPAWLTTQLGENGDYYVTIISEIDGLKTTKTVRVSTSGGYAPSDVKIAVANLFRAMEICNLNTYPD